MSKKLTRKGLALTVALSFGLTGLTSIAPAYAAAGDVVSIEPTTGSVYGVYNTDYLNIDTTIDTDVVPASGYDKLAIQIDNPDQETINIKLNDGLSIADAGATCTYKLSYTLWDDLGNGTLVNDVNTVTEDDCTTGTTQVFDIAFTGDQTHVVLDLEGVTGTSDVKLSVSVDGTGSANAAVSVTSFIDAGDADAAGNETVKSNLYSATADKYPSATEKLNFYDPTKVRITARVERIVATDGGDVGTDPDLYLNEDDNTSAKLGISVAFSPAINLDQLTSGNLGFYVDGDTNDEINKLILNGNEEYDDATRLFGFVEDDAALVAGHAYTVAAFYDASANNAYTSSNAVEEATYVESSGFTVPSQADETDDITTASVAITDETNSVANGANFSLRAGTKSFTYLATGNKEKANVPVIAIVTASDLATDGSLTIGSIKISELQSALITGTTNSDGEYSFNVSSALAKDGEDYKWSVYVLDIGGQWDLMDSGVSTYETGEVTSIEPVADVVAGSSVTIKYNVRDQFDKAISVDADGEALFAHLEATDPDDLDKYAAVTAGSVSFTFTNYLTKGDFDTLSIDLGIGGATEATFDSLSISGGNVSLYNPEDVAALNVDTEIVDEEITYDPFITGESDPDTNEAPAIADAIPYIVTAVDADGNGVPGAVVTISGAGLQFQVDENGVDANADDTEYYKGSITVAADEAGTVDLNIWAHTVSSTGITIKVTSGSKSATTELTTTGNDNVVADDLVFTWNAPKHPAVNTTYIVTTKVTDLWSNPIESAKVTFSSDGAMEVNGTSEDVKKTTNSSGVIRVYMRSLKNTEGVATVSAELTEVKVLTTTLDDGTAGADELGDGETFDPVLSADLTVGKDGAAKAGKLAGVLRVTSWNAKGKTVKVYVNGKLKATRVALLSTNLFKVRGLSAGTKTVKVVVGGGTFFNEAVTIK